MMKAHFYFTVNLGQPTTVQVTTSSTPIQAVHGGPADCPSIVHRRFIHGSSGSPGIRSLEHATSARHLPKTPRCYLHGALRCTACGSLRTLANGSAVCPGLQPGAESIATRPPPGFRHRFAALHRGAIGLGAPAPMRKPATLPRASDLLRSNLRPCSEGGCFERSASSDRCERPRRKNDHPSGRAGGNW